jgi:hypothetical protein
MDVTKSNCPVPSFTTTKQASNSSTDHGGGKCWSGSQERLDIGRIIESSLIEEGFTVRLYVSPQVVPQ